MWPVIVLLLACDRPGACPQGAVWSSRFGQCIGVEDDGTPEPATSPTTTTVSTGDTGPG